MTLKVELFVNKEDKKFLEDRVAERLKSGKEIYDDWSIDWEISSILHEAIESARNPVEPPWP